ncbi:Zinc finger and BTB domain-containing protein 46 [Abeliophyllum distichum]|uniref:Zinc finger and BTB domain-containing protein 46 n=1 Tax=Abeliophyllum distichum TaxID=126358 RepID=A0ABD1SUI2_9LAMI
MRRPAKRSRLARNVEALHRLRCDGSKSAKIFDGLPMPYENLRGMAPSTGRQALLSNRCRNVADNGRSGLVPPLLPSIPAAGEIPSLEFPDVRSSNGGGEDTNRSLSLWLTTVSFPFSCESSPSLLLLPSDESSPGRGGSLLPCPPPPPPPLRLSSIRRVFLRRRWITGLVVGLLVGLPETAHWVANSLNFCRVAISLWF